jgi:hypothetical protein
MPLKKTRRSVLPTLRCVATLTACKSPPKRVELSRGSEPVIVPQVDNGGGRADGIRLPERTEEDLYDYAFKANRTRIKRDECRDWALGLRAQRGGVGEGARKIRIVSYITFSPLNESQRRPDHKK